MASSYNDGPTFPPQPSSMTAFMYPNSSVPSSSNNFHYSGNNVPSNATFKHPGNIMPSTSCYPQPGMNNNVQNGAYRRMPSQQHGNLNNQQFNQQPGPSTSIAFNYPAQSNHNYSYPTQYSAPRSGIGYGPRPPVEPGPGPPSIEANGGFLHPGSVLPSTSKQTSEDDCITRLIFETSSHPDYNKKELADNVFDILCDFRFEYEARTSLLNPNIDRFRPDELANIDSIKAEIIPKNHQASNNMASNLQQMPMMRPPAYGQPSRVPQNVFQQRTMNPPVPMQSPQYRPMLKSEMMSPSYGPMPVGPPVRMSAMSPQEQSEMKRNMMEMQKNSVQIQRQNSGNIKQEVMSPDIIERPVDALPVQPKSFEKFQRQPSGQFMMNSPQSNGIFSPPQPQGHPMSRHPSMGQSSPAQMIGSSPRTLTPGVNQPECPNLMAALNTRTFPNGSMSQFNSSNPMQNIEDRRQSCNSPASQASGDSIGGKRKRVPDEDGKEPASKRPKLNVKGDHYRNVVNFLRENVDLSSLPLLRFLLSFSESTDRQSKRVVDFKDDEPRTMVVLKPRVFCERWKEQCGIPTTEKTTRDTPTYTKMETDLQKTTANMKLGDYPLLTFGGSREFQFLKGFKESEMLRENKSNLYLENGKLVEKPCVPNVFSHPSSNIPQQQQSQQQFVPQQRIISSAPTSFMSIPRISGFHCPDNSDFEKKIRSFVLSNCLYSNLALPYNIVFYNFLPKVYHFFKSFIRKFQISALFEDKLLYFGQIYLSFKSQKCNLDWNGKISNKYSV
uniref:Uncharacterized protein n=1 Tax=Panagrolaimus sp. JU765 TaxID=591449 RepID=A0AC34R7J9_9BILA